MHFKSLFNPFAHMPTKALNPFQNPFHKPQSPMNMAKTVASNLGMTKPAPAPAGGSPVGNFMSTLQGAGGAPQGAPPAGAPPMGDMSGDMGMPTSGDMAMTGGAGAPMDTSQGVMPGQDGQQPQPPAMAPQKPNGALFKTLMDRMM